MSGSLHLFSRKCLSDTRVWINTGCQFLQNNRVRPTALQNCLSLRQLTGFNRWQKGLMCTSCYYEEYCLRTWNVINRHLVASFLFQPHVCGRKKSLPGWLPGTISHCWGTNSEVHARTVRKLCAYEGNWSPRNESGGRATSEMQF